MFPIRTDVDLTPYTTFGLPARAAFYGELTDEAALPELCALPQFDRETVLWLGGGSNVLLLENIPHLVIRMCNKGIRVLAQGGGQVQIEAQAGEVWHDFVQYTLAQGWSGLENLSLIPGTVGAAPVQNIGAYGVEVQERIAGVRCYDLQQRRFVELSRADCAFAYRDSLFKHAGKHRYVITAVRFILDEQFKPNVRYGDLAAVLAEQCAGRPATAVDVAAAVCHIRRQKLPDPAVLGNVGSFYHNPIVSAAQAAALLAAHPDMPHYPQADGRTKLAAGWLIDRCGLKGHAVGGAAVHDKQALVLVNRHQASAADVAALSAEICARVQAAFGVRLHPEPTIWPPHSRLNGG